MVQSRIKVYFSRLKKKKNPPDLQGNGNFNERCSHVARRHKAATVSVQVRHWLCMCEVDGRLGRLGRLGRIMSCNILDCPINCG